ncbi:MAG: carboxylating nicotinate-nucleotide diphosphorylase [Gemmatimonadaceae bacterium]
MPQPESERPGAPGMITPLSTPSIPGMSRDGLTFPLAPGALDALVRSALEEDGAFNDITTIATVVTGRRARGSLVARQPGVVAGIPLVVESFRLLDPKVSIRLDVEDGMRVRAGDSVLFITGHARAMLAAERVALNFIQRLSGIASLTAAYVEAVRGTKARILDTRKTTPGWRLLEKYAVRAGGGRNHRVDLASAVLIKDNHLAALDGDIALAVRRARETAPAGTRVEVECDRREQVEAAVRAGADIVMLDNMSSTELRECVAVVAGRVTVEASGGVTLHTVREIAECGVDWISVGALTHSAPAMDLALDFE